MMKARFFKSPIQTVEEYDSMQPLFLILGRFFKLPLVTLCVLWGFYLGLDWFSRTDLKIAIDPWITGITFFFGLGQSCLLFFYFFPKIFFSKKWPLFLPISILFLIGSSWVKLELLIAFFPPIEINRVLIWKEILRLIQFQGFTLAIWANYTIYYLYQKNNRQKALIHQHELTHSTLAFNPHFIRNMLFSYLIKIQRFSPELKESFERFSSMISYSIKSIQAKNTLRNELIIFKNFLDLKLEDPNQTIHLQQSIHYSEDLADQLPFPKMVLLTLIENVFIHGDLSDPDHPALIEVQLQSANVSEPIKFTLAISNKINPNPQHLSSGFGLQAVQEVLKNHFKESLKFDHRITPHTYSLNLSITYGKGIESRLD